jgi:hypothetical protein
MSEKPKTTPGPWVVNRGEHAYITNALYKGIVAWICHQDGEEPLFICNPDDRMAWPEQYEANARLLAAAPDLLAALKAYVEWHGPTCEHATRDDCPIDECPGRPIDDAVNAAIARAEGRS